MSARLVRDNMPRDHPRPDEFRIVTNAAEHRHLLRRKIIEKAGEVALAPSGIDLMEEIADLFEVIQSIIEVEGLQAAVLAELAEAKRRARGGFTGGVVWDRSP